jgi:peptide/nickel transport system substrate-binding protein
MLSEPVRVRKGGWVYEKEVHSTTLAIILVCSLAIGQVYDRKETLYAGGGLWSPPNNWNPFTPWAIMTGTNGLIYEYLFLFDPLSNEMIPWLAWMEDG